MDTGLIESLKSKEPKFEIIGNDHQLLQIMLLPGESIVTLNENIIYCSTNIKAKTMSRPSIMDKIKLWMTRIPRDLQSTVICSNNTDSLEYLGLSRRIGEILAINLDVFPNICFKTRNFVAMTNNTELETLQQTSVIQFPLQEWSAIKTNVLNRFQSPQQTRMLFLQSTGTLIEKELGAQEEIQVKTNCVFAYANTIRFSYPGNETGPLDMNKMPRRDLRLVRAKGPGVIYIESQGTGTNTNILQQQQHKAGTLFAVILFITILAVLNAIELHFI